MAIGTVSPSVKIVASRHTGTTVRSIDRAIYLFHQILGLPLQRTSHLRPPISTTTGNQSADITIYRITWRPFDRVTTVQFTFGPFERGSQANAMGAWVVAPALNCFESRCHSSCAGDGRVVRKVDELEANGRPTNAPVWPKLWETTMLYKGLRGHDIRAC